MAKLKPKLVALLTDFGLKDSYVGSLKAAILSTQPRLTIVDVTHAIPPFNISMASQVLLSSFVDYPKGTVFVCIVDPGVGTRRKIICAFCQQRYFIGPDNGLLSLLIATDLRSIVRLVSNKNFNRTREPFPTFHGRDILGPIAARLAESSEVFNQLGPVVRHWVPAPSVRCVVRKKYVEGRISYFDVFGNAITNISKSIKPLRFWKHSAVFLSARRRIGTMSQTYGENQGKMIALFNSGQFLELAVPRAHAGKQCKLRLHQKVWVKQVR